jgi:hypothetical protein
VSRLSEQSGISLRVPYGGSEDATYEPYRRHGRGRSAHVRGWTTRFMRWVVVIAGEMSNGHAACARQATVEATTAVPRGLMIP